MPAVLDGKAASDGKPTLSEGVGITGPGRYVALVEIQEAATGDSDDLVLGNTRRTPSSYARGVGGKLVWLLEA